VSETDNVQKHKLSCMRLAAECRRLAADAHTPGLRAHFLHMADMWAKVADEPRVPRQ
jgi:hypothetical protein